MIVGGTITPLVKEYDKKSFMGVGFSYEGVPLDVVPLFQLSALKDNHTILIVDEFIRMNGIEERLVNYGLAQFKQALDSLAVMYDTKYESLDSSDYMRSMIYKSVYDQVKDRVISIDGLTDRLLKTVPEDKRQLRAALDYPMHEVANVAYLSGRDFRMKLGPGKEKQYDEVMQALDLDMDYGYVLDSYALGSKSADVIDPYIPSSKGPNNGQRIMLGEPEYKIRAKMQQGSDEALRYLAKVASVSAFLRKDEAPHPDELDQMHGRPLKKLATTLVLEHIIRPYKEASR